MHEPSVGALSVNRTPAADDAADVALAQSGDGHAFERLYRAHLSRVHSLARRMAGPDEADELTQDVFVRTWEKLGTFRGEAAFGTWLHRLAVNLILSRRSRVGRDRQRFDDADDAVDLKPTAPVRTDLAIDFETAMGRLPEGARHVFVLHDVEGYRHDEIAGQMGIAVGTSKAQLHRARMLLRGHLEPKAKERGRR
jgi:RNA polymerase sigma-70 factor (ECF subfamily)